MLRLRSRFVEMIHDSMVTEFFGGVEPVAAGQLIRPNELQSALAQPFQSAFGQECYPAFEAKAARLFFGIASGHAFLNGNKRTAVVALDLFCSANDWFLTLPSEALYDHAINAASHNERHLSAENVCGGIVEAIRDNLIAFTDLPSSRDILEGVRDYVRNHPLQR